MQVSEETLRDINDHIVKGVNALNKSIDAAGNTIGAAVKGLDAATSEMVKVAICELKKSSEILTDYLKSS